jgi:hypothetical protein
MPTTSDEAFVISRVVRCALVAQERLRPPLGRGAMTSSLHRWAEKNKRGAAQIKILLAAAAAASSIRTSGARDDRAAV